MRYIYRDVARDGNGIVITNATVNVYLAGTTTAATVYTSSTSTTGVNSVTTDATDGSFTFYVDAFDYGSYQKFKFVVSKPTLTDDTFTADEVSVDEVVTGTYTISTAKISNAPISIPYGVTFVKSGTGSITFNKNTEIGRYQVFDSTFSSGITFAIGSIKEVYPEWWGAKGDGLTDSGSYINTSIVSANGRVPISMSGVYLSSVTINVAARTHFRGMIDGYVYDNNESPSAIKFTSTLTDGILQGTPASEPYITLENITIDGNSKVTNGINIGFFLNMKNSTAINCTGPGLLITNGQAVKLIDSAFNGNQDGILTQTAFGTIYAERCSCRVNTRYGINLSGIGGASQFSDCILESNTSSGLNVSASLVGLIFRNTYYEANDAANGTSGYHIRIALSSYQGNTTGNIFDGDYHASITGAKAALVSSGTVRFRDCTLFNGQLTDVPVTVTTGADVIYEDSFTSYALITGAKSSPEGIDVDPLRSYYVPANSYSNLTAVALGTGDFTVSMTISPASVSSATRVLISGSASSFSMGMQGGTYGIISLFFAKVGSASFHTTTVALRNEAPVNITYTRATTTGTLYINGIQVDTFTDSNNYSGNNTTLGGDGVNGSQCRIYSTEIYTAALTAANVLILWQNGGDAKAARLTTGLAQSYQHDGRIPGLIYESIGGTWHAFAGTAAWLNPIPGWTVLSGTDLTFWNGSAWKTITTA